MKRALLSLLEPGRVCEVVPIGNEFEVTSDFQWVDCPNEVTPHWKYDSDTNTFREITPLDIPGFAETGYLVARQIAYKSVGEQMDMIYKELQATGQLAPDGPWASHIASVKEAIPKDDPVAVMEWNKQHAEKIAAEQAAMLPPPAPTF
jgi:NADH:ubiquinone oxidoreductase subunit